MIIKVYRVNWEIPNGGQYVPPDPVIGGDYFRDKYGIDIIPATSIQTAKAIVKRARPSANITTARLLAEWSN